ILEEAVAEVEARLGSQGRVLIRKSGTEPLIRVMIEGQDQEEIQAYANELVALIDQLSRGEG
ncbi:MAG: phosphoglucosamine mutase, partial [Clostridiaceae bacterium]|nr:phosphoglucosamine mutase [Clostridiaceae bacterium]